VLVKLVDLTTNKQTAIFHLDVEIQLIVALSLYSIGLTFGQGIFPAEHYFFYGAISEMCIRQLAAQRN